MDEPVLVVGGGIAGLALARALHNRDIPVLLCERSAGPPAAGLALNLPGNAVRAFGELGLAEPLASRGAPVRRREYRTARGRLLFAVDEAAFWGPEAGSRCVRRSDLIDLLGRDLPAGVIRRGQAVTGVQVSADRVTIELAGGATEAGGLVVGADGVRSAIRSMALGEAAPRTALLSAASWRFMAPVPAVECWTVWSGAHGTILLIPVSDEEVYGYASATRGGPVDADPEWLRHTFAGFPEPVPHVVETVLAEPSSLYHSPVEEVRIPRWSDGRAVVIGDAAHATAPVWAQGAAMAVEDALVLAELLAAHKDWDRVGAEYERRRRSRVAHVQAMTDRLSRAARLPTWLRDTLLPRIGPRTYHATYQPLRTSALAGLSTPGRS